MVQPNSLTLPDDEIVRLYRENRVGDWAQMIKNLARINGATERQIVSILNRRTRDLGDAPTPTWTGSTYALIAPPKRPVAIDDILLKRINMVIKSLNSIISEAEKTKEMAESLKLGLEESAAGRRS